MARCRLHLARTNPTTDQIAARCYICSRTVQVRCAGSWALGQQQAPLPASASPHTSTSSSSVVRLTSTRNFACVYHRPADRGLLTACASLQGRLRSKAAAAGLCSSMARQWQTFCGRTINSRYRGTLDCGTPAGEDVTGDDTHLWPRTGSQYLHACCDLAPRLFLDCRVLERVTKETASGGGNRANVLFEEDSGIAERFRNRLTDFQVSGYDRGHMVSHLSFR